ncbi:MAG: NADH-quinone oxidoreductase subunit J [Burkholderiaceae bacterium]|nr:MAG: NADH-quinone oxidoreductase subunit J [Burkholderiaceae bacterium]
MTFPEILFYLFSGVLLMSAVCVVTVRNPVHAALYLVLSFATASCIWMLLRAEFLAIALVLVYVGAVMVLFLFVVMMLNINLAVLREGIARNLPMALMIGLIIAVEIIAVIFRGVGGTQLTQYPVDEHYSNTAELGKLLYTQYSYPFELAALILLVAIIAAIALTLRKRKDMKYNDPAQQIRVKRSDRVRLVSMPADSERAAAAEKKA